jgi:hypothetical protein
VRGEIVALNVRGISFLMRLMFSWITRIGTVECILIIAMNFVAVNGTNNEDIDYSWNSCYNIIITNVITVIIKVITIIIKVITIIIIINSMNIIKINSKYIDNSKYTNNSISWSIDNINDTNHDRKR